MHDAPAHSAETRPRMVAGLRLLTRVGSGGEGEVWEARDRDGSRRALKLIRPKLLPSADELSRRGAFLRRIDHPALVRVHRTGRLQGSSLDGWGFLEMEFVDGEPLGQAPADPSALERLEPLAEGLDALHGGEWSDGVPLVHRDVKPANLIARPGGEVVLVDCSTLRGTDATHLTRVGTPVFAAPEVLTGRVGPPADVYSFGATIVALVTGARGDELARLLAEPERLDLPWAVGRALAADPAGRPHSCRAVLDAGTAIDLDLLPPLPPMGDWDDGASEQGPAPYPEPAGGGAAPPAPYPGPAGGGAAPSAEAGPGHYPPPAEAGRAQYAPRPAEGADAFGPPAVEGWAESDWPPAPDPWAAPRGLLGPWLLMLLGCAGLAWAATVGRGAFAGVLAAAGVQIPTAVWAPAALVAAVMLHVLAARLDDQPWALVLLAPPVAWAWMLGGRASGPGQRRAWVRAAVTGVLVAAAAAGLGAAVDDEAVWQVAGNEVPLATAATAGVALAVLASLAGRGRGLLAGLVRAVLAPAWLAGAALLLAGALVVGLAAAPWGRARLGARLAAGALASAGAFLGISGGHRHRQGPDPRA